MPSTHAAVAHMRADLERLDRVAHRFERIGREPQSSRWTSRELVERVATYFRARVPTLAQHDRDRRRPHDEPSAIVNGDAVLLEWALEVLVKNAIDALAGRGGRIRVSTRAAAGRRRAHLAWPTTGPGIPRELRARIFEPGFSTKKSGWGIGLSLARAHRRGESRRQTASSLPTERGATFEIIFD